LASDSPTHHGVIDLFFGGPLKGPPNSKKKEEKEKKLKQGPSQKKGPKRPTSFPLFFAG
jgi:hypothetical protein